jgi:hypothetical protein
LTCVTDFSEHSLSGLEGHLGASKFLGSISRHMSLQTRRTIFLVLIITGVVVAVGILLPVIYSSSFYRYTTGIGAWTPVPSPTLTPTLEVVAPPTPRPSATATKQPTPTKIFSCVLPIDYWIEHPDLWPPEMFLGGVSYDRDEIDLIFEGEVRGIREHILQNLYIAYLNIYTNADSEAISETIEEANLWLKNNPPENSITEEARESGLYLAQALTDFNTGLLGLEFCPSYKTQVLTPIIIEIMNTLIPTDTPTNAPIRVTRRPTQVPTRTKNPTDKPPTPTSIRVTNTPSLPTSTSRPSPEPTQPPPTPVPTEEPTPTPVP